LKLVHNMLRNDLAICQEVASEVAAGAQAKRIEQQIGELKTRSPIWALRVNCLYHCRVVHSHHHIEDADMFPALRRSNPDLGAVVDKLEADHRAISDRLDEVDAAAVDLDDGAASAARQRLVKALNELADDLLEHLAYEEEVIAPTMRRWEAWPIAENY